MSQQICHNPECQRVYDSDDKDADVSFCCFPCWEKVNCKSPTEIPEFDKIELV